MVSQKGLFRLFTLMLVLTLLLVGCIRPFSSETPPDSEGATETDQSASAETPVDSDAAASSEDTSAAAPTEVPVATPTSPAEDTTPRTDESTSDSAEEDQEKDSGSTESGDKTQVETSEDSESTAEGESTEASVDETMETTESDATTATTHTVAPGETLYRIGLKYNVSWVTLAEFNNLDDASQIRTGQVLNIPGESAVAETEPEATPSPMTETTYAVKAGDNLYRIGLAYGISWVQIAEANGLVSPNQIIVGQILKIPVDTPGPKPQFDHAVKAGETLFLISLHYGVSWPVIAEANDLESPYVIFPGQTLVIPGG